MYAIVNKYTGEVLEDGFGDMDTAVRELQLYTYTVRILLTVRAV